MLPQVAETVVVGGGPAGAASALFLARLGHRCLLLERSVPGERKLCGEFLSPEMLPLLRRLGVGETLAARGPARIRSVRITAPRSRRAWEAELPAEGWGLSRAAVDEALLQAAEREGVTVARGTMAVSISIDRADRAAPPAAVLAVRPARESGTVAIRARAVLLATGKTASPARQSRFARPSRFLAFQAHFEGPALGPRVELHAFRGGYVGLIDIEGGARNLCMLAPRMPSRPAVADDLLAMALAENETLAQWLTCARRVSPWATTPRLDFRAEDPWPDGEAMRVGDAAARIVPLAGDGLAMAVRSAQIAAPILSDVIHSRLDERDARRLYRHSWKLEFGSRLFTGRLLQQVLVHPAALRVALAAIRHAPPLGRWTIRLTRGRLAGSAAEG